MDVIGIFNAVESHAMALGVFERVNTHEPKNAPGSGMSCFIWIEDIRPLPGGSGLNSTSVLLTLNLRVQESMLQEPQDGIDPQMLICVDALMAAYSGDFDLGLDEVRNVDLLGAYGTGGLFARAGYLEHDKKMFRVMVANLPIVLNDMWQQAA